jgi:hypothetical protein
MAQDIKVLGESLLAGARQRRKKEEKRAKIFGGLMLGVSIGNHFLRQKAERRMMEFANSSKNMVRDAERNFTQGVDFWTNHNNMLKNAKLESNPDAWEEAYKIQYRDTWLKQNPLKESQYDAQALNKIIDEETKDDIAAYGKQLEAMKEFQGYKSSDKPAYMAPITQTFKKVGERFKKDYTVGGVLLEGLGLRKSPKLKDVKIGEVSLKLPESMEGTIEFENLKTFLHNSAAQQVRIRDAKEGYVFEIEAEPSQSPETRAKIDAIKKRSAFKVDEGIRKLVDNYFVEDISNEEKKRYTITLKTRDDTEQTFNAYDIINGLDSEFVNGVSVQDSFQVDVARVGSLLKSMYAENSELLTMPSDAEIMSEAYQIIGQRVRVASSPNIGQQITDWIGITDSQEFTYDTIDKANIADLALSHFQKVTGLSDVNIPEGVQGDLNSSTSSNEPPSGKTPIEKMNSEELINFAQFASNTQGFENVDEVNMFFKPIIDRANILESSATVEQLQSLKESSLQKFEVKVKDDESPVMGPGGMVESRNIFKDFKNLQTRKDINILNRYVNEGYSNTAVLKRILRKYGLDENASPSTVSNFLESI